MLLEHDTIATTLQMVREGRILRSLSAHLQDEKKVCKIDGKREA